MRIVCARARGHQLSAIVWSLAILLVSRAVEAEPILPFSLPSAAEAERCLQAREKAMVALKAEDWASAADHFRAATVAFPDSQDDWYNLGCVLARGGDEAGAIQALQRSSEVGRVFIVNASRDPDLKSLHGRPDYQQWLRSLSVQACAAKRSTEALGTSPEEIESMATAALARVDPFRAVLGQQFAIAEGCILRWKAESLLALASKAEGPVGACHSRWDALDILVDDRMRPLSEYLSADVLRMASNPVMACPQHWVEVLHVEAQARCLAAFVDAEDEAALETARQRLRGDLLALAAAAPDQPALEPVLVSLAPLTADDLPLAIRLFRRLMAMTSDRAATRSAMSRAAPGVVLAAEGIPTFEARTTAGETVSNGTMAGKWTLIEIWATWCVPCREELPRVRALYETHRSRGLEFLGIATEYDATAERDVFVKWCAENGVTWPQVLDTTPTPGAVADTLGISFAPYYLLVDPAGKIAGAAGRVGMLRPVLDRAFPRTDEPSASQ